MKLAPIEFGLISMELTNYCGRFLFLPSIPSASSVLG